MDSEGAKRQNAGDFRTWADREGVRLDGVLVAQLARRWVGVDAKSPAVVALCMSYQEVRGWPRAERRRVIPWCVPFALHLWRTVRPSVGTWLGNIAELEDNGGRPLDRLALQRGDVVYSPERGHAAIYVGMFEPNGPDGGAQGFQVEGNYSGRCVERPMEDWPMMWRPQVRP